MIIRYFISDLKHFVNGLKQKAKDNMSICMILLSISLLISLRYLFSLFVDLLIDKSICFDLRFLYFLVVFVTFTFYFFCNNKDLQVSSYLSFVFTIFFGLTIYSTVFGIKKSVIEASKVYRPAVICNISHDKGGNGFLYSYRYTTESGVMYENSFKIDKNSLPPNLGDTIQIMYSSVYQNVSYVISFNQQK